MNAANLLEQGLNPIPVFWRNHQYENRLIGDQAGRQRSESTRGILLPVFLGFQKLHYIGTDIVEADALISVSHFKGIYPKVDWEIQLDYAEKLGLGSRTYELVKL